jgi:hypothetical protein
MADQFKAGDLVLLTQEYENYVYERNPRLTIPTEHRPGGLKLVNRIAKIEEILDWDSPKGRKIRELRVKSGKWVSLPMEDCKFLVSTYFHDLKGRNGEQGVAERGQPMFSKNPDTGAPFFVKVPDWIYKEMVKKCETFDVQDK